MIANAVERLNTALAGRYRVEHELGRGGMAIVYLADDLRHGRRVAIKVLRPELAEAIEHERFSREIEVAARLSHPNILSLHDSGEADGLRWFVMPFIEGESLRDVIRREGQLDVTQATTWVREIANALSYAHAQGLVHRDIKPENVLLQAGHAVVCDFGIAKATKEAQRDNLTGTGSSLGTFAYMSPEQLADGAQIDGRTDIYGLGCVLHEMLEGEVPFTASTPHAAMAKKLMGETATQSRRHDVPEAIWDVVRRALATEAADRFSDAQEVADALERATTEVALESTIRRTRRRSAAQAALSVAIVVSIAGGGAWLAQRAAAPTYDRIAVVPFENGTGDPREDFYVQGVQENLVEEMQRAGLGVLNPSSTRRIARTGASNREIAETLNADIILEGSVERLGPRVIVDVRLVDPLTEEVVWFDDFTGDQSDVVTLLHGITLDLAVQTGATLTPEALAVLEESTSIDPVLYELLLQGRFEGFKLTEESLDQAERYYARAVARDSMSGEAWSGLAEVWSLRAQQGLVAGNEASRRYDSILARAPVPGLDPARQALFTVWPNWQQALWDEAEDFFLKALEQRPSDAATRAYYAQFLSYLGRVDASLREGERAARQAPDDALVQGLWAQILTWEHRLDEAEAVLTRAREFNPDAPYLLSMLRTTYHLQGRDSLAMDSWRDSYRVGGDLEAVAALERGYQDAGYGRALRSVGELFERRRDAGENVSEWQIGTLYTRAGDTDKAIEYLTLALDEGDPNSLSIAVDAIFDPLRGDVRFQALVDRLQLPR